MERIWLKQYPHGVPHDIDLDEFSSIKDILEKSCEKFRAHPAYTSMGATLSYADVDGLSRRFGAYLQKVAKLDKGDRVAVMMPNLLQYPITVFGALRAGMTVVNVNPLYTPRELEHQLKDSGAKVIVVLENFAHTLQEVLPKVGVTTVVTTRIGDQLSFPKSLLINLAVKYLKKMVPRWRIPGTVSFNNLLEAGARETLDEVDIGPHDIAFLQYTGGTTGVAKGAVLSHGNMVANLQQSSAWLTPILKIGEEAIITALPLYHIFSLTANCLTFMKIGGHNILIANPRDFTGFVKELKRHRFTVVTGVNTLFNALVNTPGFDGIDFGPLKLTIGGGMAVQRAVAEGWESVTGTSIIEAYGLTETSPGVCINPLTNREYNGSIGTPLPSTYITLRDEEDKVLDVGEIGELCVKGPQVMRGYWNRPEETAKVMLDGEWLRTGDMARIDEDGFVFIEDRKKDMLVVSGFNVYPNEVEAIAVAHPGIQEAACIGVPDEVRGEIVKLFVVKKDSALSTEDVVAHCKENLTGYKVPKLVEFREDLPKTNVGKILRRELRD